MKKVEHEAAIAAKTVPDLAYKKIEESLVGVGKARPRSCVNVEHNA